MSQPFPPYPPQQPPVATPTLPPSPSKPPRRPLGLWWLVIGLGSIILISSLCAGLVYAVGGAAPKSTTTVGVTPAVSHTAATAEATARATSTTAHATPTTIRLTATNPPQPAILTGATFGGTLAGFVARYGPADSSGSQNASWGAITIAGQSVALGLSFDSGTDGQPHVVSVQASPANGGTWDTATAFSVMQAMYPGDYTFLRNDTSNPNFATGIEKSGQLAATLPSS